MRYAERLELRCLDGYGLGDYSVYLHQMVTKQRRGRRDYSTQGGKAARLLEKHEKTRKWHCDKEACLWSKRRLHMDSTSWHLEVVLNNKGLTEQQGIINVLKS